MDHGFIPSSWLAVVGSWSPRDLLPLLDEVDRRGVDRRDLKAVREVWEDLKRKPGGGARQRPPHPDSTEKTDG